MAPGSDRREAAPTPGDTALPAAPPSSHLLPKNQLARRERIIETAANLLASSSYDRVQMADVAEAAGVALATVYRYFSSKEQLFAEAQSEERAVGPQVLPKKQRVRREQIIDAAIRLLAASAYDKVQMTDVAEEAGVALGTVYRYFSSKEHLFSAALVAWAQRFQDLVQTRPARGATQEDRLVDVYARALRAHQRSPQFYSTFRTLQLSSDPAAQEALRQLEELTSSIYLDRVDGTIDEALRGVIVFTCNAVMEGLIVRIASGAVTPEEAGDLLTSSIRTLVRGAGRHS